MDSKNERVIRAYPDRAIAHRRSRLLRAVLSHYGLVPVSVEFGMSDGRELVDVVTVIVPSGEHEHFCASATGIHRLIVDFERAPLMLNIDHAIQGMATYGVITSTPHFSELRTALSSRMDAHTTSEEAYPSGVNYRDVFLSRSSLPEFAAMLGPDVCMMREEIGGLLDCHDSSLTSSGRYLQIQLIDLTL